MSRIGDLNFGQGNFGKIGDMASFRRLPQKPDGMGGNERPTQVDGQGNPPDAFNISPDAQNPEGNENNLTANLLEGFRGLLPGKKTRIHDEEKKRLVEALEEYKRRGEMPPPGLIGQIYSLQ